MTAPFQRTLRKNHGPGSRGGFTLSELLIALVILGIIATVTIPKILVSQQNQKKYAIFKESVSSIANIIYTGVSTGQITDGASYKSYLMSHINAVTLCPTDSTTEGCWDTATQGTPGNVNRPGFILANGCRVAGIDSSLNADGTDGVWIDWNGTAGGNAEGDDQMAINICVTSPCTSIAGNRPKTSGVIGPSGSSQTIYNTIFQSQ